MEYQTLFESSDYLFISCVRQNSYIENITGILGMVQLIFEIKIMDWSIKILPRNSRNGSQFDFLDLRLEPPDQPNNLNSKIN